MTESGYVVIGSPIHRKGAFVIEKFFANQKEIQSNYPSSELVLVTEQQDFVEELKGMLKRWGVRGDVLLFEVVKPDYASAVCWHVACGREAIRQYTLSRTEASHLLSIDADMTFDSNVINIMLKELGNHDIVASGYPGKTYGMITGGQGCMFISRNALEKIRFRCYEFRKHRVLDEGEVFAMDLFSMRIKFKGGYFLAIDHYNNDGSARHIEPHSVSLLRKISNCSFLRYLLMKASIIVRYNIPGSLQKLLSRFF